MFEIVGVPDGRGKKTYHLGSVVVNYIYEGPVVWNEDPPRGQKIHKYMRGPFIRRSDVGFFAYKHRPWRDLVTLSCRAVASVSLFGTVIEYSLGYRAQGLRIDRILIPEGFSYVVEGLDRIYRCPINILEGVPTWHSDFLREALSVLVGKK